MLLQGDYMSCYLVVVPGLPAAGAGCQLGRAYEHGAGAAHRARALHPRHRDTEDSAARLKYFFCFIRYFFAYCVSYLMVVVMMRGEGGGGADEGGHILKCEYFTFYISTIRQGWAQ